jgi:ketosteroid isomerase-like protein
MSPLILLLAALAGAAATPAPSPAPLDALAEAERAFARASVEKGVRASFLEFFAPDGLAFGPAPENVHQSYAAAPAPPARPPVTLDWAPITGDVSASGDLGWTTGPYSLSDDRGEGLTRHGYYFSVWKKQADGAWKVLADFGTLTVAPAGPRPAFRPVHAEAAATGAVLTPDELLDLDRELSRACAAEAACLAARLHEGGRLHRDGLEPIVGRDAARGHFASSKARAGFEPLGGGASRAGDLVYTYGRYRTQSEGAAAGESGYYLRVWRRTPDGWRISADVAKAEPAATRP